MTAIQHCELVYQPVPHLIKKCWDLDPEATVMQLFGSTMSAVGNLSDEDWAACVRDIMFTYAGTPEMKRHELNALRSLRQAHKEMQIFLKSFSEAVPGKK